MAEVQSIFHKNQTAPTISAAQTSAGVNGTAVSGNDQAGVVTITTGTTAASGALVTINFAQAYKTAPKAVFLTRVDTQVSTWQGQVTAAATNSIVVATNTAPGNSLPYKLAYLILPEDGEV